MTCQLTKCVSLAYDNSNIDEMLCNTKQICTIEIRHANFKAFLGPKSATSAKAGAVPHIEPPQSDPPLRPCPMLWVPPTPMPLPYVRATPTPTMMSWREGWEEKGKGRERDGGRVWGREPEWRPRCCPTKVELSILNKNIEDGESWIIVWLHY